MPGCSRSRRNGDRGRDCIAAPIPNRSTRPDSSPAAECLPVRRHRSRPAARPPYRIAPGTAGAAFRSDTAPGDHRAQRCRRRGDLRRAGHLLIAVTNSMSRPPCYERRWERDRSAGERLNAGAHALGQGSLSSDDRENTQPLPQLVPGVPTLSTAATTREATCRIIRYERAVAHKEAAWLPQVGVGPPRWVRCHSLVGCKFARLDQPHLGPGLPGALGYRRRECAHYRRSCSR